MIQVLKDGKYAPIELTVPLNAPVKLRSDWIILSAMYVTSGGPDRIRLLLLVPVETQVEGT